MLYFTHPMDTPEKIAYSSLGYPDADFADQIRQVNAQTLAYKTKPWSDFYSPYHPIWIPDNTNISLFEHQQMICSMEKLSHDSQDKLIHLQKNGIDTVTAAHAYQMTARANLKISQGINDPFFSKLHHYAVEFLGGAAHAKEQRLMRFEQTLDEVKTNLFKIKTAVEEGSKEQIRNARSVFKKSFQSMQSAYQDELENFRLERQVIYRKYWKMESRFMKEGIKVLNSHELKAVARFAKSLKYIIKGVIVAGIVEDSYDVYEAYKHHGHWLKLAIEDAAEVGAAVLIGIGVAAVFTGGGWAVLLVAGAADVLLNLGAD